MKLVRGWEKRYAPDSTGGLRLRKARLYRAVGEEEGLGDRREGEFRMRMQGKVTSTSEESEDALLRLSKENQECIDAETAKGVRESLAMELDDPELEIEMENLEPGVWESRQNLKVEDSALGSPFLFCLSREPATISDWERLRAALPERYDTWTVTEDVASLNFEIACGIKRWMWLNEITEHRLEQKRGWVAYSYDTAPLSDAIREIAQITRWFRKGRKYKDQEEYRLAWNLQSPQWESLPDALEIELTRTGLGLFKPWEPPKH